MKISTLYSRALTICAGVMLAGCGGSQPPIGALGAMPQTSVAGFPSHGGAAQAFTSAARSSERVQTWMLTEASAKPLIYISTNQSPLVYVYTFKLHLVGELNVGSPQGECTDKVGNVWITDTPSSQLVEYAHGGSKVIRTISDSGQQPVGCSVNQTTGDLAVANICSAATCGNGDVAIFAKARGRPRAYFDPSIDHYFACAYDDHGNLLVDGRSDKEKPSQHVVFFSVLSVGAKTLRSIAIAKSLKATQNIQWVRHYFAIEGFPNDKSVIYHISIASSGNVKVLGLTKLESSPTDFFISGKQMLALYVVGFLSFLHYPSGMLIRSSPLDWFVKEPDFLVVSSPNKATR